MPGIGLAEALCSVVIGSVVVPVLQKAPDSQGQRDPALGWLRIQQVGQRSLWAVRRRRQVEVVRTQMLIRPYLALPDYRGAHLQVERQPKDVHLDTGVRHAGLKGDCDLRHRTGCGAAGVGAAAQGDPMPLGAAEPEREFAHGDHCGGCHRHHGLKRAGRAPFTRRSRSRS